MSIVEFRFYATLDRLVWPRSYIAKFFMIGFIAVHLPLISIAVYALIYGGTVSLWTSMVVLTIATLVGTTATLVAFWHLLAPILAVINGLHCYLQNGVLPALPTHFQDEVGMLLRDTRSVLQALHYQRQQLSEVVNRDHLTGLLNRRSAEATLEERLARHMVLPERGLSLGMLDIDHFKRINDTYGHQIGDLVLQGVSGLLAESLRTQDVAARWGGEEFMLCFNESATGTYVALERLRQRIADKIFIHEGHQISVTVSIGYSDAQSGDTLHTLFARADQALYGAKNAGRNQIAYGAEKDACPRN